MLKTINLKSRLKKNRKFLINKILSLIKTTITYPNFNIRIFNKIPHKNLTIRAKLKNKLILKIAKKK